MPQHLFLALSTVVHVASCSHDENPNHLWRLLQSESIISPAILDPTSSISSISEGSEEHNDESNNYLLNDDCWRQCLECLDDGSDFLHFQTSSRRFAAIYDEIRNEAKFRNFELLFQNDAHQIQYRTLQHLLQTIPCIPSIHANIYEDERSVCDLFRLHSRSEKSTLRGLISSTKRPFLSFLLWKADDWDWDPLLLVAEFGIDRLQNVIVFMQSPANRTRKSVERILEHRPETGGVMELKELLRGKYFQFKDRVFPFSNTKWTVGRRWQSRLIRCRRNVSLRINNVLQRWHQSRCFFVCCFTSVVSIVALIDLTAAMDLGLDIMGDFDEIYVSAQLY